MKVNLVVITGRFRNKDSNFVSNFDNIDLTKSHLEYRRGRIEFYHLGNRILLTKRQSFTLYLSNNIRSSLEQITKTLKLIKHIIYQTGLKSLLKLQSIQYSNIHCSGQIQLQGKLLYTNCMPILLDFSETIFIKAHALDLVEVTITNFNKFESYLQFELKHKNGNLKILYSGYYTIITNTPTSLSWWTMLINRLRHTVHQ